MRNALGLFSSNTVITQACWFHKCNGEGSPSASFALGRCGGQEVGVSVGNARAGGRAGRRRPAVADRSRVFCRCTLAVPAPRAGCSGDLGTAAAPTDFTVVRPTLEDVFVTHTEGAVT